MQKNNGGLSLRLLQTQEEKLLVAKERHHIFTVDYGWTESQIHEVDKFDDHADFIGVMYRKKLVAFTRIIRPNHEWMFDSSFKHLLKKPLDRSRAGEISRFFVPKRYRKIGTLNKFANTPTKVSLCFLLLKGAFHYSRLLGLQQLFFVTTPQFFRLLKILGLPAFQIGEVQKEKDGEVVLTGVLDWKKLCETKLFEKNYQNFIWFVSYG